MIDASAYCRELEAYLCRKNEGHLIRIVGPVFEQVCGWAERGVPLKVAFRGIDRYCERYYAKGPRRRPVRVEFCEADILELFDDWRRATGVRAIDESQDDDARNDDRSTLPTHIDRAIARLTALRGNGAARPYDADVDAAIRELDGVRARARQARGEERAALVARLGVLDRALVDAAAASLTPDRRAVLMSEADGEIAPFAARMAPDARGAAVAAAFERLVRDDAGLPVLSFE
jgi:hypothetical protein